jgi:hypothetical protein
MRTADRNKTNQEAWKNVTPGVAAVYKFNTRGELEHELVQGSRTLNLTPEERRINQEMCADEANDLFQNGILVPVRLIDDEDIEDIKGNPNHITEEDMRALLKGNVKTFDAKLGEITNAFTVRRMFEMAGADDLDVSHRKVQSLEARLGELEGNVEITEREVISGPNVPKT